MPFLSFVYGAAEKNVKWYLKLLLTAVLSVSVYLFMANGGMSLDYESLYICIPSLIALGIGLLIRFIVDKRRK